MGGLNIETITAKSVCRYGALIDLARPWGLDAAIEIFVAVKYRCAADQLSEDEKTDVILTFTPLIVDLSDQARQQDRLQ